MQIAFKDAKLERTYLSGRNVARLGDNVFKAFVAKVRILAGAASEADLYEVKSLHFEKLSGDREGQRSIRLNGQFRLVFELRRLEDGTLAYIIEVVDYH